MTQKSIFQMTRKEILAIPRVERGVWWVECKSFIVIPTARKHDSGYNCMEVIAVDENSLPLCKATISSDVINLQNYEQNHRTIKEKVPQNEILFEWRIDCLSKSKLLRFFKGNDGTSIRIGCSNMNIEGFVKKKKGE